MSTRERNIKILAGATALFFIAKNYFLNKSNADKETVKKAEKTKRDFMYNNVQTFTNQTYQSLADGIYNMVKYGLTNRTLLIETLNKMLNDIDVKSLIDAYGSKQTMVYGEPIPAKDLLTQLSYSLGDRKDEVNTNWSKKFIKYRI